MLIIHQNSLLFQASLAHQQSLFAPPPSPWNWNHNSAAMAMTGMNNLSNLYSTAANSGHQTAPHQVSYFGVFELFCCIWFIFEYFEFIGVSWPFIETSELPLHSMEISAFFCNSDFAWNQSWRIQTFQKLKICHFSTYRDWILSF